MKHTPQGIHVIPDTFNDRFEVKDDQTSECPLEWGWDGEFHLMGSGHSSTLEDYNSDHDAMRAFVELADRHNIELAQKVVKRFFNVDVKVITLRGYSQGDWWEIAYFGYQPIEPLAMWLRGDVYTVHDLETDEYMGGIYAENMEAAAKQYALDEGIMTAEEWDNYGAQ